MATSSRAFQRSVSPGGRFSGLTASDTSSFSLSSYFASSTKCTFNNSSSSNSISQRRVTFQRFATLSFDRSGSRGPSAKDNNPPANGIQRHKQGRNQSQKRICLCSPSSHPGSFRCRMHKNSTTLSISYIPNRLAVRKSAMKNSIARIGTVEGNLMQSALVVQIRPSCHRIRRRNDFQPRPSRLSIMSGADYKVPRW